MRYLRALQKFVLIASVVFAFNSCQDVQDKNAREKSSREKAAEMDILVQKYHTLGNFNGTVLVAEKGEVILEKGYGMANMEWGIPNEPDTKMRLGSITKQFTSMLIMQLVEQGKIDLQTPITNYLPDYRKETGTRVTIHHLLTHTSGIPSYTGLPNFFSEISRDPYGVDEFIEEFCSGDLEFEPGTEFRYNNSGYFLLGAIIEKVAGKTYEETLQKKILDPLGMKNTGYDRHGPIIKKRATGYQKAPGGFMNSPYLDMGLPYAAGSLYSTVEDLYIWDRALYSDKLLKDQYMQIMYTPFIESYAYGWGVTKIPVGEAGDSLKLITHGGGINGFNTIISRLVEDQHLIVLLNNTGGAPLNNMSMKLKNILYEEPYEMPKKSIGTELYEILGIADLESVIDHYDELKKNQPDEFDFRESELNMLGYRLMTEGEVDMAIGIFQLNAKAYPNSSNVYDSLGEAFMNNDQKEQAIKNYERSLELDPDNSNAVEMLKELKSN